MCVCGGVVNALVISVVKKLFINVEDYMAWYTSMSGKILPRLVLLAVVLTGTQGSVGGHTPPQAVASSESEILSGISGLWGSNGLERRVWAARGSSIVLPCHVGGRRRGGARGKEEHGGQSPPTRLLSSSSNGGNVEEDEEDELGSSNNSNSNNNNNNKDFINGPNSAGAGVAAAGTNVAAGTAPSSSPSSSSSSSSFFSSSLMVSTRPRPYYSLASSPRTTPSPNEWINWDWRLNNVSVVDRRKYYTTPTGDLNITKVTHRRGRNRADEGEFRCVVTTPVGVLTSPPIQLHVASLTKYFDLSPKNITTYVGEAVRLSCQIDSQPPASLIWTHDEQPLPQDDRYTTPISGVLHIVNVQMTDAGIYKCRATNSLAGKTRQSNGISVTVVAHNTGENFYMAPSFLSPKIPVRVVNGKEATLECLATGVPMPTITWQRKLNISEIQEWEEVKSGTDGITIIGQGTLILSHVYNTSAGRYMCTAKSVNPTTKRENRIDQEIDLDVMIPPAIIDPPMPLEQPLLASTVRLNCSVTGHPTPHVTWYKNGLPIEFQGQLLKMSTNQLVILNSMASDTGMYQCLAINDAGYASSWAPLIVISSMNNPDPPKNLQYKILSSTSVLLEWDPVILSIPVNISAYTVHFFETEGNKIEHQKVSVNVSIVLENLKPNTLYTTYVRAYSSSASDVSEKLTFRTAEDVPVAAPKVTVTPLSPTTLLVRWTRISPEDARGVVTGYKIHWQKYNYHYYNVNEVGPNIFEYKITDLFPGKRYEVKVLAGTKMGYPTEDDILWISQKMPELNPEDSPPPPVVNMKVLNDTSGTPNKYSLKVDWEVPDKANDVKEYKLKYRQKGSKWKEVNNIPSTKHSLTIDNLDAAWYDIEVQAIYGKGKNVTTTQKAQVHAALPISPDSNIIESSIEEMEVEPISQTSVHVSWKDSRKYSDPSVYYMVKYQEITSPPMLSEPHLVRSDSKEIVITGLKPFSTYEFSVRAHEAGKLYSSFCPPMRATTMENLPVPPERFVYLPTDTSTISLTWNPPEHTKSSITSYEILYTLDQNKPLSQWEVQEVDGEATSDTVSGLISNTPYYFKIRGCIGNRCGGVTDAMIATIPTVLKGKNYPSGEKLYLICGLVAALLLLLVLTVGAIYIVKTHNTSPQPRILAWNGNGHINGKRSNQGVDVGQSDGSGDMDGQELEVYVPMLTRIPPDFKCPPLDTKGGYPEPRVNGLNNPRCNGFIKSRDQLQPVPLRTDSQGGLEENEHLVIRAGSSSSCSSSNGATKQSSLHHAFQNHHPPPSHHPPDDRNIPKNEGHKKDCSNSHSPAATPPPSPLHQHNHSGVSQDGLTNLTNLTTLSGVDSDDGGGGGVEHDRRMVDGAVHHLNMEQPHQYHHQNKTSATKMSSPQSPLTTMQ